MHHRNNTLSVKGILAIAAIFMISASTVRAQEVVRNDPMTPAAPATAVREVTLVTKPAVIQPTVVAPKPVEAAPAEEAAPAVQYVPASDSYGFTGWLNATRAQYGLRAVGFDPNLANWAAVNNGHQNSRGMGHFVMGPARRQNCAMGNYAVIGSMWMASPAHRAALLDPTISFIGIAGAGAYWTFNAY